jgi:hypothetical protein
MTWAGMEGFQPGKIKEAYQNPYFINRGEPLPQKKEPEVRSQKSE